MKTQKGERACHTMEEFKEVSKITFSSIPSLEIRVLIIVLSKLLSTEGKAVGKEKTKDRLEPGVANNYYRLLPSHMFQCEECAWTVALD